LPDVETKEKFQKDEKVETLLLANETPPSGRTYCREKPLFGTGKKEQLGRRVGKKGKR